VATLRRAVIADLKRRQWIHIGARKLTVTRAGHLVLKADGDNALREIFTWLKSDEAKRTFQK
jgi:accessory colonization factor AcfC